MNAQAARDERPGGPRKRPGLAAPEVNWYIQKATYPQNNCGIGSCMFCPCTCLPCMSQPHACHACLSRMLCYPAMARGMRAMRVMRGNEGHELEGDEGDEAAPWRAARMGAGQQGCRGQQRRAGQQGVEVRS